MRNAFRKRRRHRNARMAHTNGQSEPNMTRSSPRFQNRLSNFIHDTAPDQLLKRTDKIDDRSAASIKRITPKEFPLAEDSSIEA